MRADDFDNFNVFNEKSIILMYLIVLNNILAYFIFYKHFEIL